MKYSFSEINSVVRETGFNAAVIEKALQLLNLLNMLNSHPYLKKKLALKGGTALNLFILDMPRLSVDIDLNYIGALDLEEMTADRPKVEQAMQAVFEREGFAVKRVPGDHAGGKWRLAYPGHKGDIGNLEVDVNFMFRQPLWEMERMTSHKLGEFQAKNIPVVNLHELYAGKLAALFSRQQARDLFDAQQMLNLPGRIDVEDLRLAFVVYGAMNSKDWRMLSLEDISFNANDLKQKLFPVLKSQGPHASESALRFGEDLVNECRRKLSVVYPLANSEMRFLDAILDKGEIKPELLTDKKLLQERIAGHPMLNWKALNVRKRLGKSG